MDDDKISVSSSVDEPLNPKHISELTFTSWADQYSNCQKMIFQDRGEKESRLFWLKTTKDFTKLCEMQRIYQFLRYAQLRPKLHRILYARYFEKWRVNVHRNRWERLSNQILHKKYLEDINESFERVKIVREKIAQKTYTESISNDKTKQSLDIVASDLLNTVNPLNILAPKPEIPIRDFSTPPDSPYLSNELESPKSPKSPKSRKSPRSPKSPKSPKSPESPLASRDINLEEESVPVENQIVQKCNSEVQTVPLPKKNNLPAYALIFVLALLAGIIAFFFISPAGAFKSSFNQ